MSASAETLLRPPGDSTDALSAKDVQAAIERRQTEPPITEDPIFGQRSLKGIVDLHRALRDDEDFRALADALAVRSDVVERWDVAKRYAASAGVDHLLGGAVAFLLAERNTSFANESPLAVALALATAETFGVPENRVADGSPPQVAAEARRLVETQGAGIRALLEAQRQLTAGLFSGASRLTLYRGERRERPVDAGSQLPVHLRPLCSWTTSHAAARSLPEWAPDAAGGGQHIVVFIAEVPVGRVLSTSCTGFGSQFESELVVIGGRPGDTCFVVEA